VPPPPSLGQWERQSLPLVVSGPYGEIFDEFYDYFKEEMRAIDDDTLEQELDILNKLRRYASD
jgi:Ca-activated chloride channel family protein